MSFSGRAPSAVSTVVSGVSGERASMRSVFSRQVSNIGSDAGSTESGSSGEASFL